MIDIVTHNGIFHADEVVAVALLRIVLTEKEIFVTRTRDESIIKRGLLNPETFVIDVGGKWVPGMRNFDHHQSLRLRASNMLVFNYIKETFPDSLLSTLMPAITNIMLGISNWDTNGDGIHQKWFEFTPDNKYKNFSQIINGFNRNPKEEEMQDILFSKAVDIAKDFIYNEMYAAEQKQKQKVIYQAGVELTSTLILFDAYCNVWKKPDNDYNYAIMPNAQGWALVSRDADKYPIEGIDDIPGLMFAHKAKFIAIFQGKQAAISAGAKICGF